MHTLQRTFSIVKPDAVAKSPAMMAQTLLDRIGTAKV